MSFQHTTLSNGLTVYTMKDDVQTVKVGITVDTGSRNEDRSVNGISHFLEHLFFKSTTNHSTQELADRVERSGGISNASTSQEMTRFFVKSMGSDIDNSLSVLADMMINPAFKADELDVERGVILQEIVSYADDPMSVAWNHLGEILYPDQAIGRTILGDESFIKAATADDFRRYRAEHYTTGNSYVWAVGDVDHESFVKMVEGHFALYPVGERKTVDVPVHHTGFKHVTGDFQQTALVIEWEGVAQLDERYPHLVLLDYILNGGMSSPLFTEVREKRGLVYSIGSSAIGCEDHGMFIIHAGTTAENVRDVVMTSMDTLRNLVIDDETLQKAKNQKIFSTCSSMEKAEIRFNDLISAHRYACVGTANFVEKLKATTVEDVLAVKAELLAKTPSLVVVGHSEANVEDLYKEMS